MLDHISMMFSTDENFSFFNSSVNNFTMQYSNTSWGMERHNAGGLWDLQNGSCHHTLWAHHRTRNPKARPSMLEWINNVTFHWRNEGVHHGRLADTGRLEGERARLLLHFHPRIPTTTSASRAPDSSKPRSRRTECLTSASI